MIPVIRHLPILSSVSKGSSQRAAENPSPIPYSRRCIEIGGMASSVLNQPAVTLGRAGFHFNLPAVPVLAEPTASAKSCERTASAGEARESTIAGFRKDRPTLAAAGIHWLALWYLVATSIVFVVLLAAWNS